MKKLFQSKLLTPFSLILNAGLILLVIGIVVSLYKLQILPPFSSTTNSINDIPIFDQGTIEIEQIATELEIPWDLEFIEDGKILVTERTGKVRIIQNKEVKAEPALDLSNQIVKIGEAGLMGMAKDSGYFENKLIYLYYTYKSGNSTFLKVATYKFENDKLTFQKDIIDKIPAGSVHSGGQMEFGPDGKLYITTGDIGEAELAQDMNSLAGKTLRINPDGTIPTDNPFKSAIYSSGHRNAQGLDWHPVTQEMYQSEHGPSGFDGGTGMDEINIIKRGGNLGWPTIRGNQKKSGMYSPLLVYTPAVAPASATFYDGEMFPDLENKLLVGTLRGNSILVIQIDGSEAKEESRLVDSKYGRIRYVGVGPDGAIYFTTSNRDGRGDPRTTDDGVYQIYKK